MIVAKVTIKIHEQKNQRKVKESFETKLNFSITKMLTHTLD